MAAAPTGGLEVVARPGVARSRLNTPTFLSILAFVDRVAEIINSATRMDEDLRLLEQSKNMLEGFHKKIRSHFDLDRSASNFSNYFTDTDGAYSAKPPTAATGPNLFREARSMSDHMRRRFIAKQREERSRPPEQKPQTDIVQRIVESNRASVHAEPDEQSLPPPRRVPLYSVSKQISLEHIAYERRIDEYQEIIANQQKEIEDLRASLAAAMQDSQLQNDYSLPPSLENKLVAIRSRGLLTGQFAASDTGRKPQRLAKAQTGQGEPGRQTVLRKKKSSGSLNSAAKSLKQAGLDTPSILRPASRSKAYASGSKVLKGVFPEEPLTRQASKSKPRTATAGKQAANRSALSKSRREKLSPAQTRATSKTKPGSKKNSRSRSKTSKGFTQATSSEHKSKPAGNPLLNPILNLINSFN